LLLLGAESFVSTLLSENMKIKISRIITLPVVLYGCEIWSLTMREECGPRKIFGLKRDDIPGEQRKLHKEELSDLCSSPNVVWGNQIEENEMGGACSM